MPPIKDQNELFASGYQYIRCEHCLYCGSIVETFSTPGKRELAFDPMPSHESPAIQHYETCTPKEKENGATGSAVQDTAGRDSDSGNGGNHQPGRLGHGDGRNAVLPGRLHDSGLDVGSIKLHGVTDPNYNLLAAGWAEGTLRVRFSKGEGFHVGVPGDLFLKLKHSRFALRQYNLTIKDKFQYTKVE